MSRLAWAALAAAVLLPAPPARADADLFSRDTVHGLVDLRLAAADGERSWTDRGYGKLRYSGAGDDIRITPEIAEAALVWKPRFSWNLNGVVHLQAQPDQAHLVDVVEAFVNYKPVPSSAWRFSGRAGLFYPPISMEHEDLAWGTTHTITPSAINSWVGEEVKVVGVEAKVSRTVANQELGATIGAFGFNDTSGTLLSLRGWALHDLKAAAFGDFRLPLLQPRYRRIWRGQAPDTVSTLELDDRVGFYGRFDWRTPGPLGLNLFYYDNAGNRTAVENGQWSWETRFWNLGVSLDLDERTRILSQVMTGETLEGFPTARGVWIEVGFASAYVLATRRYGAGSVTARVDYFETTDRTWQDRDDNNEDGWAFTGAYRYDLSPKATWFVEAMHVTSDRNARFYRGEPISQGQTLVQSSLRLRF